MTKTTSSVFSWPALSRPSLSRPSLLLMAVTLITVTSVGACTDKTIEKTPATEAQQAISHAQARYDAAQQVDNAWSNTKKLIDTATDALSEGDFPASIAAAEQATALSEASIAQEQSEQSAWQNRFPKAP